MRYLRHRLRNRPTGSGRTGSGRTGLLAALALAGSALAATADPGPIRQVSAGYDHTCAVTEAGEAWCWGGNHWGQLGTGDRGYPIHSPVRVSTSTPGFGAANIAWIEAGAWSTCALTTAGQIFCWGDGLHGNLGTGPRPGARFAPVPIHTDHLRSPDIRFVSLGSNGYRGYTPCALTESGRAFCWGENKAGTTGSGRAGHVQYLARAVSTDAPGFGRTNIAQISASGGNACALNRAGRAFCWGDNEFGALGNGTTQTSRVPVRVDHAAPGIRNRRLAAIGAGGRFACALTDAGRVTCWGRNDHGQLGNGSTTHSPVALPVSTGRLPFRRGRIAQIALGGGHACAVTEEGRAFCWGRNLYGAVGDGRPAGNRLTPVPVATSAPGFGKDNIAAISLGSHHSCALNTSGAVFCWGANQSGQAGVPGGQRAVWRPKQVLFGAE